MPKDPADDQKPATRRRGRPVQMDPARRECVVLEAAAELLAECRPDEVTMTSIARRAGMSKRTIYGLYDSREELLGACLARMGGTLFRPLNPEERGATLEDRLRIILTMNSASTPPEVPLEMLRALIAEARSYPDLACGLSREGPGQVVRTLTCELSRAARAGEIALAEDDAEDAARLLFDMVMGNAIDCLLDPSRILRLPEERVARRDRAIDIFLNGLRPRD